EILRTKVSGARAHFLETPPRGEFVLILHGAPEETAPTISEDEALALVALYRAESGLKEACRRVAAESGHSANALYARSVKGAR
ncbi:MAG: 16S rRNA (cytidine(1402)-2'-O)-methyltransferase, partial [Oscillospiraceae bacterium]|nr:16S rRNA (cytidine(1402)-2'-O)-methyltransferase [Oscillospiraceae bacterium]